MEKFCVKNSKLQLEILCSRNIVLREFMFVGDYNENDYLYLPKP